jgi:UDP-N-acetylmuramate--alanine ligase
MHMSAIARILLARGHAVSGSDTNRSDLTDALERLGATVHIGPHADANVPPACDLLVHTSAVNETNPEVAEAIARGLPHLERAQMVAVLMADHVAVCVAGCHGKSTTSGMVAFVLKHAGRDPTYLIGAEVSALGDNAAPGTGPHVVVEADEYARAFLEYSPDVALVTNVEPDHLDYYGTYEAVKEAFRGFASNVKPGGTLLLCADNSEAMALSDSLTGGAVLVTYALDAPADYRASLIEDAGGMQHFNVSYKDELLGRYSIQLAARHNVQNALGVIAICRTLGLTDDEIRAGLAAYSGVRRRFEFVGEVSTEFNNEPSSAGGRGQGESASSRDSQTILLMDDYAHHPTEVANLASAAHSRFPGRRIVALFQPHTYARSMYLLEGWKTCFRDFDRLFILETYAAREPLSSGLTAAQLAEHLTDPPATYCADPAAAVEALAAELKPGDVFFTVGAGDVNFVGPALLQRLQSAGLRQ